MWEAKGRDCAERRRGQREWKGMDGKLVMRDRKLIVKDRK